MSTTKESPLVAYCGLYCGACSFRVAYETGNLAHIRSMPDKYDQFKQKLPEGLCPGCKLENDCGDCRIRDCARSKDFGHCGECSEFPCDIVNAFNQDGIPHHAESVSNLHKLKQQGEEAWKAAQDRQWTCAECGAKLSWYLRECPDCSASTSK